MALRRSLFFGVTSAVINDIEMGRKCELRM